jgi:hypothetical protein
LLSVLHFLSFYISQSRSSHLHSTFSLRLCLSLCIISQEQKEERGATFVRTRNVLKHR